jgi:hypothetical protein
MSREGYWRISMSKKFEDKGKEKQTRQSSKLSCIFVRKRSGGTKFGD